MKFRKKLLKHGPPGANRSKMPGISEGWIFPKNCKKWKIEEPILNRH